MIGGLSAIVDTRDIIGDHLIGVEFSFNLFGGLDIKDGEYFSLTGDSGIIECLIGVSCLYFFFLFLELAEDFLIHGGEGIFL